MTEFRWDAQSLRWFSDFSRFTGFHEKLAALLSPALAGCDTLCDVGCGAGLVDLCLADAVGRITCVDRSETAVSFLRREAAARGIGNITAVAADCAAVEGSWDAILFSFFGTGFLERFLPRCRRLICVTGDEDVHGLVFGRRPRRHSAAGLEAQLRGRDISFSVQRYELEAGQPFSDRKEAVRFVRCYSGCTEQEAEKFLAHRLISVDTGDFSCYMPYLKPIAVFTVAGGLR